MAGCSGYLECIDKKLHEKNKINEYLEKAEKAIGIRRLYIALGLAGFWALYMILGHGAELICNSIGFGYPAYKSITALETHKKDDDTKWLTYWVTFATFSLLEFFSEIILGFVPFYWLLKCVFLMWCFAPIANNGSQFVYSKFIRPVFLKNQKSIDEALEKAKSGVADLVAEGLKKSIISKKLKEKEEQERLEKIKNRLEISGKLSEIDTKIKLSLIDTDSDFNDCLDAMKELESLALNTELVEIYPYVFHTLKKCCKFIESEAIRQKAEYLLNKFNVNSVLMNEDSNLVKNKRK